MSLSFANTAQLKKYCPVKLSFNSSNASYQKQPFELIGHHAAKPVLLSVFQEICSPKIIPHRCRCFVLYHIPF